MPTYYQKPENALNRSKEFISVGKHQSALDCLYDVIKSKKHRTWQKIHEPIMEKYLGLCVDLKKSHMAKEGLYQYKNICQQVNVKSLEDVIRKYLNMAEEKTEYARKESQQSVAEVEVDDLDVPDTPESMLMNAVSGEGSQDRSDRAILTPWVKFLWESYRQCLDLLRNNSRVERLYQDVAQQAFKFCLKYARKTEFRKLCDNLRMHLNNAIGKQQNIPYAINLSNPETLQLHLESRLAQLDTAILMELWQEAFKAVEDIHHLIALSKKPARPSLLVTYYSKFGMVLWKSQNQLFHAATWHRLYLLNKDMKKNISAAELRKLSNIVLCATLAVPLPPSRYQIDQLLEPTNEGEKRRRLATLLELPAPPTRASLILDLEKNGVLQYVSPELKQLYRWLEVDFHPLKLSGRIQTCMDFMNGLDELNMYSTALNDITVIRLIKQVAQAYETIQFSRLAELAPKNVANNRLESIVVQAAKNIDLPVRMDHRTRTLSFGTNLSVGLQEEVREGPFLQQMPGERVRDQLKLMALALHKATALVGPTIDEQKEAVQYNQLVGTCKQMDRKDHDRMLQRKNIIEERKETQEKLNEKKLREEREEEMAKDRELRHQEEDRLKKEMAVRERQRQDQEREEVKRQVIKARVEQLRKTDAGEKALAGLDEDDLAQLDDEDILQKQVEQLEKEKKELADRLRLQEKKVDYLVRAKVIEEIPARKEFATRKAEENRVYWETWEANRVATLIRQHEEDLANRNRLAGMVDDMAEFRELLMEVRKAEHKVACEKFEVALGEERKVRLERRRMERIKKRKVQAKQDRIDAARREEERIREEERDRLAAIEQDKIDERDRLLRQQERQRQREEEIEEKQRKEAEAARAAERSAAAPDRGGSWRPSRTSGAPSAGPAAGGNEGGGWRRGGATDSRREERSGGGTESTSSWRSKESSSRMDYRESTDYERDREQHVRGRGEQGSEDPYRRDDKERSGHGREDYDRRGDDRSGYGRRDDRDGRRDDRSGYDGGYSDRSREDDRGGNERRDERSGGYSNSDRGWGRDEGRSSGYSGSSSGRRDETKSYERRDDNRGYDRRNDNRRDDRRDDRGYERRDDRRDDKGHGKSEGGAEDGWRRGPKKEVGKDVDKKPSQESTEKSSSDDWAQVQRK